MQKTSFNFRLIIGEDFSTDRTRSIIEKYATSHPNIIHAFYRERNLGANENSKLLFEEVRSKYVALCEGDDYWIDPNKLQLQVDFLEANPDYSICFHNVKILQNNNLIDDYITKVPAEITSQKDLLNSNYIHTVSVVYRNILKEMPDWFRRAMPADYPLWMMLTANNNKIECLSDCMAVYRVHSNGIWRKQNDSTLNQRAAFTMLTCVKHLNIKDHHFIEYYIRSLAESIKNLGFEYLSHREYLRLASWSLGIARFSLRTKLSILSIGFRQSLGLLKAAPGAHDVKMQVEKNN